MKKPVLIEMISFLFIVLFVYAALSKLLDYEKFSIQIGQSPMLAPIAKGVAWSIPLIELFISLLLVFPSTRIVGFFAGFSLMVMFTAYIVVITNYAHYVPCSCGGILQNMGWTQHLIFNIVFVILAFIAIVLTTATGLEANSSSTSSR